MKKFLLLIVSVMFIISLYSCSDDNEHLLNGQWQLNTISDHNNDNIQYVDTVYYSFQRAAVFSFTVVNRYDHHNKDGKGVSYGYVDFPAENKVHILIDRAFANENFLHLSGWDSCDKIFNIDSADKFYLVLSDDEKIYTFKRF